MICKHTLQHTPGRKTYIGYDPKTITGREPGKCLASAVNDDRGIRQQVFFETHYQLSKLMIRERYIQMSQNPPYSLVSHKRAVFFAPDAVMMLSLDTTRAVQLWKSEGPVTADRLCKQVPLAFSVEYQRGGRFREQRVPEVKRNCFDCQSQTLQTLQTLLFPFNRRRRLRADVVDNAINSAGLAHDSR